MRVSMTFRNRIISACALIICMSLFMHSGRLRAERNQNDRSLILQRMNTRNRRAVTKTAHNGQRSLMEAANENRMTPTLPPNVSFTINNPDLCTRSRNLRHIIYFTTAPGNFLQRMLMRNTWVADDLYSEGVIGRVFLVGQTNDRTIQEALEAENEKYKDIVQGDFLDSYFQLSLKGVMALKWISTYCKHAQYAIKADDDTFVNIFGLIHILEHFQDQPRAILGHCWGYGEKPTSRDHKSEWYLTQEEMSDEFLPDYCIGLLYAISQDIIPELYQAALTTPMIHIEDLYITGLLASKIGNVQHIGFKKNFTFDMVNCKKASRDLRDYTNDFGHVASECSTREIPMLWQIYQQRSRLHMHHLTGGMLRDTCKVVDVQNKPEVRRACR